jgi:hypothetical protein
LRCWRRRGGLLRVPAVDDELLRSLALLVLLRQLGLGLGLLDGIWRRCWRILGLDALRWRQQVWSRCGWRLWRSRWGAKGARLWPGATSPTVEYLFDRGLLALRRSLWCHLYGRFWCRPLLVALQSLRRLLPLVGLCGLRRRWRALWRALWLGCAREPVSVGHLGAFLAWCGAAVGACRLDRPQALGLHPLKPFHCLGLLCFDCPHRFQVGVIRQLLALLRAGLLRRWQRAAGPWHMPPWWQLLLVALGGPCAW